MQYDSVQHFLRAGRAQLAKGPVALVFVEDDVEVDTTLRHHLDLGFAAVITFMPDAFDLAPDLAQLCTRVSMPTPRGQDMVDTVNAVTAAAPGLWIYFCFNAEYLFYPFCESRTIGEMLAFHTEERRDAMLTYGDRSLCGRSRRHAQCRLARNGTARPNRVLCAGP